MLNKLDKEFYFNKCVLNLRSYRQELLASNIANSDTPNYQPLDIDFSKALNELLKKNNKQPQFQLTLTSKKHIPIAQHKESENYEKIVAKKYIIKKNKINMDVEKVNFINNSLLYQMDIIFINNKFKSLMNVLKG